MPGVSSRSRSLWSPIAFTVIRSMSGRGAADSEYGCELNRMPGARNRQRKNWPASAPIRCSFRPPISTDTMPGVSSMTASTRIRCRMLSRIGVRIRYQTTSAVTEPYSAYQTVFAIGSTAKSLPVVSWCQNVRNTAAYVSRWTWYQVSYGILRRTGPIDDQADENSRPVPMAALPMSGSWLTESIVCWTMSPSDLPACRA